MPPLRLFFKTNHFIWIHHQGEHRSRKWDYILLRKGCSKVRQDGTKLHLDGSVWITAAASHQNCYRRFLFLVKMSALFYYILGTNPITSYCSAAQHFILMSLLTHHHHLSRSSEILTWCMYAGSIPELFLVCSLEALLLKACLSLFSCCGGPEQIFIRSPITVPLVLRHTQTQTCCGSAEKVVKNRKRVYCLHYMFKILAQTICAPPMSQKTGWC